MRYTSSRKNDFLVSLRKATVRRGGNIVLQVEAFDLLPGQHWALLGANGAGKSTFLALLRGELWPLAPDSSETPPRLYGFNGTISTSPLAAKGRMPLVAAELQQTYQRRGWRITALECVTAGLHDANLLYAKPNTQQVQCAIQCLKRMDALHLAERLVPSLSQGELRRVLIARALLACEDKPAVLLLDEVCDGLDAAAREQLIEGLERIMKLEPELQLIYTSHRSEELPKGLTHVAVFQDGHITHQGPATGHNLFTAPPGSNTPHPRALETMVEHYAPARPAGEPLLEIQGVDIYRDGVRILSDIAWTMRQGEHWGIVGANGAGKSTLLELICGTLHPACVRAPAGEVRRSFDQEHLAALRSRIGLVSPALQAAWPYASSVFDVAASGLDSRIGLHGMTPTRGQTDLILQWLQALELDSMGDRPLAQLSNGQQRRCFLARALLAGGGSGPALLALDEPCSGLDAQARSRFLATLGRLARAGMPILLASHHQDELIPEITHVLLLHEGRIMRQGVRGEVLPDTSLR